MVDMEKRSAIGSASMLSPTRRWAFKKPPPASMRSVGGGKGALLEIAEYCCFDVKVTRLVHEHGCRHKELFFHDRFAQKQRVEIDWAHLDGEDAPTAGDAF